MESSIFGFIWKYSKRQQLVILALSVAAAAAQLLFLRHSEADHQPCARLRREPGVLRLQHGSPRAAHGAVRPVPGHRADQRRLEICRQRLCRRGRRAHAAPPALPALQPSAALPPAASAPGQPGRAGADDQRRDRGPGRLRRRGGEHAGPAGRHAADQPVLHVHAGLEAGPRRGGPLSLADLHHPQAAAAGEPAGQGAGPPGPPQRREDQRGRGRRARHPGQRRHRRTSARASASSWAPCSGSASLSTRRSS